MSSRDQLLSRAVSLVERGMSVDIVGDRGAGRSFFLGRVRNQLLTRGWRVTTVRGNASFRSTPLLALSLAGLVDAPQGRPFSVVQVTTELAERLAGGQSVLLIDDWHDLDEASWGVVRAAHLQTEAPIVLARTRGLAARYSPTGLAGANLERTLSISLPPLRFDEFRRAIAERTGYDLEPSTLSQLYALAGGNIGIGVAIAEAATSEQRLQFLNGQWVATADLWCNSLALLAEALIEPLAIELREALELIAFVGLMDENMVRSVVGDDALEQLEALGLIVPVHSGARRLVTVDPPLIVEYFRGSPHTIRRTRLLEKINALLAVEGGGTVLAVESNELEGRLAPFVRVVHERLRTQFVVARAEWAQTQDRATGAAYVDAAIRMALPDAAVDDIFAETADSTSDEHGRVVWAMHHAEHRAFHHGEAESVVAALRKQAQHCPRCGGSLLAKAAELEHAIIGNGDLTQLADPDDQDLPLHVRIDTHRTIAFIRTSRGELAAAHRHLEAIQELSDGIDATTQMVSGIARLLSGNVEEALLQASSGFGVARAQLDPERLRAHGFVLALSAMFAGRHSAVDDVLDTVVPLADPVSIPPFTDRSLTIISAVLASRRGHRNLAERRVKQIELYNLPDSPLPGGNSTWAHAQLLASAGELDVAAAMLDADGDAAWDRGARAAGALAYLAAIELEPTNERLRRRADRIRQVEGRLIGDEMDFAEALVRQDITALETAARALAASGRLGLALFAYNRLIELLPEDDDNAHAVIQQLAGELRTAARNEPIDEERFRVGFIDLTDREEQVARLAVSGLSNQQIADELVLSVRTVESHMHRVMKKLGTTRRTELLDALGRLDRDPAG